jgi:hypothetical protein
MKVRFEDMHDDGTKVKVFVANVNVTKVRDGLFRRQVGQLAVYLFDFEFIVMTGIYDGGSITRFQAARRRSRVRRYTGDGGTRQRPTTDRLDPSEARKTARMLVSQ